MVQKYQANINEFYGFSGSGFSGENQHKLSYGLTRKGDKLVSGKVLEGMALKQYVNEKGLTLNEIGGIIEFTIIDELLFILTHESYLMIYSLARNRWISPPASENVENANGKLISSSVNSRTAGGIIKSGGDYAVSLSNDTNAKMKIIDVHEGSTSWAIRDSSFDIDGIVTQAKVRFQEFIYFISDSDIYHIPVGAEAQPVQLFSLTGARRLYATKNNLLILGEDYHGFSYVAVSDGTSTQPEILPLNEKILSACSFENGLVMFSKNAIYYTKGYEIETITNNYFEDLHDSFNGDLSNWVEVNLDFKVQTSCAIGRDIYIILLPTVDSLNLNFPIGTLFKYNWDTKSFSCVGTYVNDNANPTFKTDSPFNNFQLMTNSEKELVVFSSIYEDDEDIETVRLTDLDTTKINDSYEYVIYNINDNTEGTGVASSLNVKLSIRSLNQENEIGTDPRIRVSFGSDDVQSLNSTYKTVPMGYPDTDDTVITLQLNETLILGSVPISFS